MSLSDLELLRNIIDEVNFILDHANGKSKEAALNDPVLYRALIRSIEVIGEATKKLSEHFKSSHPSIEWKKMAKTRDILIHVYFDIDNDIVWDIISQKLPPLQKYLDQIIIGGQSGI